MEAIELANHAAHGTSLVSLVVEKTGLELEKHIEIEEDRLTPAGLAKAQENLRSENTPATSELLNFKKQLAEKKAAEKATRDAKKATLSELQERSGEISAPRTDDNIHLPPKENDRQPKGQDVIHVRRQDALHKEELTSVLSSIQAEKRHIDVSSTVKAGEKTMASSAKPHTGISVKPKGLGHQIAAG